MSFVKGINTNSKNASRLAILRRHWCSKIKSEPLEPSPLKRDIKDIKQLLNESSPLMDNLKEGDSFETTAYPEGTVFSKFTQGDLSLRPKCDPQDTSIILFPGQGTQFVGMGKDLIQFPVAQDLYAAASEILGFDLLKVSTSSPTDNRPRELSPCFWPLPLRPGQTSPQFLPRPDFFFHSNLGGTDYLTCRLKIIKNCG